MRDYFAPTKGVLAFWILVILSLVAIALLQPAHAQTRTKIARGDQIILYRMARDSTLDSLLFTPGTWDKISKVGPNGRPESADSAYKFPDGVIMVSHLSASALAQIMHGLVDYSDTSGYAITMADGSIVLADISTALYNYLKHGMVNYADTSGHALTVANYVISDSNKISGNFNQQLRGDIVPYLGRPYIHLVEHSQSSDYSTRAGTAAFADSILYASTDTVSNTRHALYADSVSDNAIDRVQMVATAMLAYLLNTDQQAAFGKDANHPFTGSAKLTGNNPPVDSAGFIAQAVRKLEPSHPYRITTNMDSVGHGWVWGYDSSRAALRLADGSGTVLVFNDSTSTKTVVQAMIDASINHAIGDSIIDSIAAYISTDLYGIVDADCVAFTDQNRTITANQWDFPHHVLGDSVEPSNASAMLGRTANRWNHIWGKTIHADTLYGASTTQGNIWLKARHIYPIQAGVYDLGSSTNCFHEIFASDYDVRSSGGTGTTSLYSLTADGILPTTYSADLSLGASYIPWASVWANTIAVHSVAGDQYLDSLGLHILNDSLISIPDPEGRRFVVGADEYYGLKAACGLSGTNPPMTFADIKTWGNIVMDATRDDGFWANWRHGWDYIKHNQPACWDSVHIPNDATFYWPHDIPIDPLPGDTTIDPFPHSGILIHMDSLQEGGASSTYEPMIVDPHLPSSFLSESIVNPLYNDSAGKYTGYFGTVQGALDNVRNWLVNVKEVSNSDTMLMITKVNPKPRFRYGNVTIDTFNYVPHTWLKAGAWFCRTDAALASKNRWTMIKQRVNDSVFVVEDKYIYNDGNLSAYTGTGIIALPQLITVDGDTAGAPLNIAASLQINGYAPLTIRGRGVDQTIITSSEILLTNAAGSNVIGLPLTLSDFTFVEKAALKVMLLTGRVNMTNLKIINEKVASQGIVYDAVTGATDTTNYLTVQNVAFSNDSDSYCFYISDTLRFQSQNCSYQWSGSSGLVLNASVDMINSPMFFRDNFYNPPTSASADICDGAAQTGDVNAIQCYGGDFDITTNLADGGSFAGTNVDGSIYVAGLDPPVSVTKGYFRYQSKTPVK